MDTSYTSMTLRGEMGLERILYLAAVLCFLWPAVGKGQELASSDPEPWEGPGRGMRVGVIAVGEEEEFARWRGELAETVVDAGGVVVQLASALAMGDEDWEVGDILRLREAGQEAYFYRGAQAARDLLEREVFEHLEVSRGWMVDEERSDALMVAALFLLRAARDLGDEELSERLLRSLVGALPAHEVPPELFPPDIVELVEEVRQKSVRASGSSFYFAGFKTLGSDCVGTLNGQRVEDGGEVFVEPWRAYLVGYSCADGEEVRAWWHQLGEGERRDILFYHERTPSPVLELEMDIWAERGDLQAVIYMGPGDCTGRSCVAVKYFGVEEETMWVGPVGGVKPREVWERLAQALEGG